MMDRGLARSIARSRRKGRLAQAFSTILSIWAFSVVLCSAHAHARCRGWEGGSEKKIPVTSRTIWVAFWSHISRYLHSRVLLRMERRWYGEGIRTSLIGAMRSFMPLPSYSDCIANLCETPSQSDAVIAAERIVTAKQKVWRWNGQGSHSSQG